MNWNAFVQAGRHWYLPSSANQLYEAVEEIIAKLMDVESVLEDRLAKRLRTSGAIGVRRYASGQMLTVRSKDTWFAAKVISSIDEQGLHRLDIGRLEAETMKLHAWNHGLLEVPLDDFRQLHTWWKKSLEAQHSRIQDAVQGEWLDVMKQCVAINLGGKETFEGFSNDAHGLSDWLISKYERLAVEPTEFPARALITGQPASGKTTLLSQVIMHSLEGGMVPILVKVQKLQQWLLGHMDEEHSPFALAWNWVDAYLRLEYGDHPSIYRFLRQSMMARRALILLDGLDEGGVTRTKILTHVKTVLAQQGHVMVVTSRPAAVMEHMDGFHDLELSPLDERQQKQAVKQRLQKEKESDIECLLQYIKDKFPCDAEGIRMTSNPLMLSMLISVFKTHVGIEMPQTMASLYEEATEHMLERSGIDDTAEDKAAIAKSVQALFFVKHVTGKEERIITECDVDAAKRLLRKGHKMDLLLERIKSDRMPLISLVELQPLKMQAAHLSFQEYFVAKAVCEEESWPLVDDRGNSLKPWHFSQWWTNTLKFGFEMGHEFRNGLLKTSDGEKYVELEGHRRTAAMALGQLLQVAQDFETVQLAYKALDDDDAIVLFEGLGNGASPHLKALLLDHNAITDKGLAVLLAALTEGAFPALQVPIGLSHVPSRPGSCHCCVAR